MKIRIVRDDKGGFYTAGRLYVGNTYLCDTLEPRWRDLLGVIGAKENKIPGATCIPDGEYDLEILPSRRYMDKLKRTRVHPLQFTGGYMPTILHVPFFSGILIHPGNTVNDTQGCILVGERGESGTLKGGSSTAAFRQLYSILTGVGGTTQIEICSTWSE